MAQLTSHPRLLQGCTKFKHCYAIYLPSSTGTFFVRMMTAQFRWLIKSSDNQSVPRVAGKVQGSQPATRGGSPLHLHLRSFGHLVVIYMKGIMNRHDDQASGTPLSYGRHKWCFGIYWFYAWLCFALLCYLFACLFVLSCVALSLDQRHRANGVYISVQCCSTLLSSKLVWPPCWSILIQLYFYVQLLTTVLNSFGHIV